MSVCFIAAASLLFAVTGAYCLWILVSVLVGLRTPKLPAPPAEAKRFAVLICARNEEAVLPGLLDSLRKQDYPADRMQTFVVAHNCTDGTAAVASEFGAEVIVRNDPNDRCKGDAMRVGVRHILDGHPGEFDFIAVFDADNLASRGFLREMNAALQNGADVVQGFRASKNYHANGISQLFGSFWLAMSDFQNLPHSRMGLPSCVSGTGFAFRIDALPPSGWETVTFLEDVEFSVRLALRGKTLRSDACAVFYDEQPTTLRDGLRQRFRWAVGMQEVMRIYAPQLLRSVPKLGRSAWKLLGDICINPIFTCTILGLILLFTGLLLSGAAIRLLLTALLVFLICLWVLSLLPALGLLRKEREPVTRNLTTLFCFAPFLFLSFVFGAAALFVRKPRWVPIRHTDTRRISEVEPQEG